MKLHIPASRLGRISARHPSISIGVSLLIAGMAAFVTVRDLRLEPDRNALIRRGRVWNDRFEAYRKQFAGTRDFIIVAQGGTSLEREDVIDDLAQTLGHNPAVASALGRFTGEQLTHSLLVLMPPDRRADLQSRLSTNQEMLAALADDPSLENIFRSINRRISQVLVKTAVAGLFELSPDPTPKQPLNLSFLLHLAEDLVETLTGLPPKDAPWETWFGLTNGKYLTAKGGIFHLLLVTPTATGPFALRDGQMFDQLVSSIQTLSTRHPNVQLGITGQRAINVAEMRATVRDTRLAGILALIGISMIFAYGFRRPRHVLFAVVALCIGIVWSAGALTVTIGHLTVLSVAFTSILLGLGIDFGIHLVARFEDAEAQHLPPLARVDYALNHSCPGNVSGALTTSAAFFGLAMSDFLGLAELGMIAGIGVLLCLVAQLVVLPSLLVRWSAPTYRAKTHQNTSLPTLLHRRPRYVLLVTTTIATVGYICLPSINFDGNLLNLQADGVEAVKLEKQLIGDRSGAFAVATSTSIESARRLGEQFERLPEVSKVDSLAQFFPNDLAARIRLAQQFKPLLPSVAPPEPLSVSGLRRQLDRIRFKLQSGQEQRWSTEQRPETKQLNTVRERLETLANLLSQKSVPEERLSVYQTTVANTLRRQVDTLRRAAEAPRGPTIDDIPPELRSRLFGKDGSYLVRIYPSIDVWDDDEREQFVRALRAVHPEVTGIPIQSYEAAKLMVNGYVRGGMYALLLVILVLAIDLRKFTSVALALLPLTAGGGILILMMALGDVSLNLANLIILPLMIGIGIDIGVHLKHRFIADRSAGNVLATSSTGVAVVLSSLTTAVGFGSLTIAQHQGIRSIGIILSLGVLANLLGAFGVLAPVLQWILARRTNDTSTQP